MANPACVTALCNRLASLRPDAQRRFGKMTAPQMVCHLKDSFLAVMSRKPVAILPRTTSNRLLRLVALWFPMRWPPGYPTRPKLDQEIGGTPPGDFVADVSEVHDLMLEFAARPRRFEFHPHPIFQELTETEWMRWGYLHTDHHLRQFGV